MVEFFYRHVFYFGEFVGDKRDVAGVAGLSAEGDGRHVRGVGLQKHLVERYERCCISDVLRVVECDDSCESDKNVGFERKKLCDEFWRAGKAMDVNVAVVETRGAEHGEGVVIGFAEMEYEWFAAFDAELQVAFKEFDLGGFCFGAVMVIEAEFSAGDALGVLQKFHHSCFVFGSLCFDVFGMDAVSGVDERILFAEFAGAVEVGWVTGDMDECFWLSYFGGSRLFFGGAAFACET